MLCALKGYFVRLNGVKCDWALCYNEGFYSWKNVARFAQAPSLLAVWAFGVLLPFALAEKDFVLSFKVMWPQMDKVYNIQWIATKDISGMEKQIRGRSSRSGWSECNAILR